MLLGVVAFPNRGVQNGQAAGRRTRAHRCRHRGRVCGHAGSARADGVENKSWFVVGLDLRNTVRKQLVAARVYRSGARTNLVVVRHCVGAHTKRNGRYR